jgi:hypothetical protein
MIDGIKILNLSVSIPELLTNRLLLFPLPVNENGGEILNNARTSVYKGLAFTIKNNNAKLNGSLHKYHNNGLHNYNDFHFYELVKVIQELTELFNINPETTAINNLEFGVNIHIRDKTDIVFRSIINYKGIPFQKFNIAGAKGIECITDNFYIKIYDKSHQYQRPGILLRYEIKVRKMKFFPNRGINIHSLTSLLNHAETSKLTQVLTSVWNEILFTDYFINSGSLRPSERLILSSGNNPTHWEQLKPNSKDFPGGNTDKNYISQRKKYYRELAKFKKTVDKYSTSTIQTDLQKLIETKCFELLRNNSKTVDKFPDLKNAESGQIHISNIVGYCPQSEIKTERLCLTCKTDISHKKLIAKFCSKKCKNDFTNPILNPKNNLLNAVKRMQRRGLLFQVEELLTTQQIELLNRENTIQPYINTSV